MSDDRLASAVGPCHHCPDRHAGCHAECPKYQAFRRDREEIYQRRKASMDCKDFDFSVRQRTMQLYMAKKKRGQR